MNRFSGWVLMSAWLALAAASAAVFQLGPNGRPMHWNLDNYDAELFPDQNPQTLAIRYHLPAGGWSAANRTNELNALRDAFALWQGVPGMRVRFEEAAPVSNATDVNSADGLNTIVWLPSNRMINQGTTFFPAGVTGLTVLAGSTTDEIIAEADIVLNRDLPWFTEFDPDRTTGIHVESVALHEIGHLLGLNHATLGGATMFWQAASGIGATAGLSADDVAGIRTVYGAQPVSTGAVRGRVTLNGASLFGAVVTAEDAAGRVAASGVSGEDGTYELAGLPPGPLRLRVTSLDPAGPGHDAFLVRGLDLDPFSNRFGPAPTDFLPRTNEEVTITAGQTTGRDLNVPAGAPPFRITETRRFLVADGLSSGDECIQLKPGQTNAWVAVYVPGLGATMAVLRVTGEGLEYGATEVLPQALRQLTRVQVPVSVAPNAAPGLRSISLTANGFTAWANGFVEVLPATYDFNGDGLDDLFQRRYFSPFTRPEAGPEADPDGDGFTNRREAAMGSDPTNKESVNYRITSVKRTVTATTITWESAPGRKYRVWSRERLENAVWQPASDVVTASGESDQWVDARAPSGVRFYRVEDAP